jgi:hypothetical protein
VKERILEQCVWLTQEEAIGLLELVMMSPGELTGEQRAAVMKLSECCRRSMGCKDSLPGNVDRATVVVAPQSV